MNRLLTLIAENIFVVIGFAIYGVLLYYMIGKTLHLYTGKKTRGRNPGSVSGRAAAASFQKSSGFIPFFPMFKKGPDNADGENLSRKNFSRNIPAANSYEHGSSQQS